MSEDASSGRSWFQSLRSLVFRREPSLRDQIEDAIEEAEDGEAAAHGDLSAIEREMLLNLLHFGERTVGDIAVPRSDIIAVPTTISFADLVKAFADAGHSRLPVYRDNLDDVSGMVHIKDVFAILARNRKPPATITKLIRQPLYVPAARGVLDVLADMRAKRIHLAIVIDEYSGTEGLVTIEDIVEEIVGDIEDEHDDAPVEMLVNVEDGIWEADARAELEDVANIIDPRLGEVDEDVDTLGGLAFVLAGHVPQVGEVLAHDSGWRLEITEGDERRVTRVRLHAPLPDVPSAK
ncbi:MAG: hemolysin family protein [Chakrabartia godavariana]